MPESLPEFRKRREPGSIPPNRVKDPRWTTWLRDGQTVIRTNGGYDTDKTQRNKTDLEAEDADLIKVIKEKEQELAQDVPQCLVVNQSELEKHQADSRRETAAANQQADLLTQTKEQIQGLIKDGKGDSELASLRAQEGQQAAWVDDYRNKANEAAQEVSRATTSLENCRAWQAASERTKKDAEDRRSEIHEQIAEIERQRVRAKVYLDFWKSELEWATRVGLIGAQ